MIQQAPGCSDFFGPFPDFTGFPAIHVNIDFEDSFPLLFDLAPGFTTIIGGPPGPGPGPGGGPGLGGPPGQFAGGGGGGPALGGPPL